MRLRWDLSRGLAAPPEQARRTLLCSGWFFLWFCPIRFLIGTWKERGADPRVCCSSSQMVGCTRRGCWCANGCHMGKVKVCCSNCGPFKDLWWSVEDLSLLVGVFLVYIKCMTTHSKTFCSHQTKDVSERSPAVTTCCQHQRSVGAITTHLSASTLKLQSAHMSTGGTWELEPVSLALPLAGAGI